MKFVDNTFKTFQCMLQVLRLNSETFPLHVVRTLLCLSVVNGLPWWTAQLFSDRDVMPRG